MISEDLVPLGIQYEKVHGQCNGFGSRYVILIYPKSILNLSFRSLADLLVMSEMSVIRDVPQCSPEAGAVPCELLDFSQVRTAQQFAVKMEQLHKY